ncbi:MAG TPA: hypothetical protein VD999_04945 [Vitreimonas sp.]|nr:hypothetical protein [Vitreimonas sp.]
MEKRFFVMLSVGIGVIFLTALATWWYFSRTTSAIPLTTPFSNPPAVKELPLLKYTLSNLRTRTYHPSTLTIEKVLSTNPDSTALLFSYTTLAKKMSGQVTVPTAVLLSEESDHTLKTIVMLRGYVPLEIYETGVGTRNAAAAFAKAGYLTVAPDFFGYGESDPEPSDSWQARFEKPIIVVELLKTLQTQTLTIPEPIITELKTNHQTTDLSAATPDTGTKAKVLEVDSLGLWGHSNGGQIALTTLEVLNERLPTTLWAPVTAPFPYSILFFSDESDDEGKATRKWLAQFEADYDVFDFTLTQHLQWLQGPLQIHHGTADEAALQVWSTEFIDKIELENKRRSQAKKAQATLSAEVSPSPSPTTSSLEPIEIEYHVYPGADHNLQPGWATVVERDITFFAKHL